MKHFLTDFSQPFLFAHRGASSLAPENTLAAFKKARELGCPGVELDVHLCKSGEIVVIHDFCLGRVGRIDGQKAPDVRVEDLTFEELRHYEVGSWFSPDFAGEKIATLEQVIETLGQDMYVDIEIKSTKQSRSELSRKTAELLNRLTIQDSKAGRHSRFIMSSFDPMAVWHFKKHSSIPTAIIFSTDKDVPFYLRKGQGKYLCKPDMLKPSWRDMPTDEQQKLPGGDLPSIIWTVDDPIIASRLLTQGALGIISNRPQDMLPVITSFCSKE